MYKCAGSDSKKEPAKLDYLGRAIAGGGLGMLGGSLGALLAAKPALALLLRGRSKSSAAVAAAGTGLGGYLGVKGGEALYNKIRGLKD